MNTLLPSMTALLVTLGLIGTTANGADEETVKLEKKGNTVVVTIGGEEFAVYNFSKELTKPYFSPVKADGGVIVTRPIESDQREHPWHRGIWVAVDEVNDIKFWAEKGKIQNFEVKLLVPEGNPAKLLVVNNWLSHDEKPMLSERTTISIYPNRLFVYDIEFMPVDREVVFGDTKEGLFGIRVAPTMTGKMGGAIVNAQGCKGEGECWGKPSEWVDYSGNVGGKTYGVAIFDSPTNFRPSRYHVRDYGLFTISPFGESAYTRGEQPPKMVMLPVGKSLRLRYGLYIHSGNHEQGHVPEAYEKFVKIPRDEARS